jgi:hypothetical protein
MKTFSESHIKYWTLGLKDAEHNKEFVERQRKSVYERTKLYIVFLFMMALLNLLSLLQDTNAFIFIEGQILATIAPLLLLLVAAKFRPVMVEFMMPATVLVRMLAVGMIRDDYMQLECMPVLLDNARKNIPVALFLGETLILRANYYMLCLVACPLTFVAASLDKQAQTQLMLKGVKFCPID